MPTIWITCDPTLDDRYRQHATKADAEAVWAKIVEAVRDSGDDDGWGDEPYTAALFQCEKVTGMTLRRIASADDMTEDGARCREQGWDFIAEADEVRFPLSECPSCARLRTEMARGSVRLAESRAECDNLRAMAAADRTVAGPIRIAETIGFIIPNPEQIKKTEGKTLLYPICEEKP
jgi:hypothetical protein